MKSIPGPKTPAIVQQMQWTLDPGQIMETCAQKYGDIFILQAGLSNSATVYVSSPQAQKEILTRTISMKPAVI